MNRLLLFIVFVLNICEAYAQRSNLTDRLMENAITFKIEDDTLDRTGHDYFSEIFKRNRVVVLGEYHGSKRISELVESIIPIYAENGGKSLLLEIGPYTAYFLNQHIRLGTDMESYLAKVNSKYKFDSDDFQHGPIPFLYYRSDAAFLSEAIENRLEIIGLDQEFLFGYQFLLDEAFSSLSDDDKVTYEGDFTRLRDTITYFYEVEKESYKLEGAKRRRFSILFRESDFVQRSLLSLASIDSNLLSVIENLQSSNDIYYYQNVGNWWVSNKLRTTNFIDNFVKFLNSSHNKEKLLIKIGGLHAAKGINGYNMYDIGNTLYEYARLNKGESIHIVFMNRFETDDEGQVTDVLSDTTSWFTKNFHTAIHRRKHSSLRQLPLRSTKTFKNDAQAAARQTYAISTGLSPQWTNQPARSSIGYAGQTNGVSEQT